MHTYTHTRAHTHVHMHAYTHTHTRTRTRTYMQPARNTIPRHTNTFLRPQSSNTHKHARSLFALSFSSHKHVANTKHNSKQHTHFPEHTPLHTHKHAHAQIHSVSLTLTSSQHETQFHATHTHFPEHTVHKHTYTQTHSLSRTHTRTQRGVFTQALDYIGAKILHPRGRGWRQLPVLRPTLSTTTDNRWVPDAAGRGVD